jgi:hypothetical protein
MLSDKEKKTKALKLKKPTVKKQTKKGGGDPCEGVHLLFKLYIQIIFQIEKALKLI